MVRSCYISFSSIRKGCDYTPNFVLTEFFSQDFVIECDALGVDIDIVLMQSGHPIAYFS